MPEPFSLVMFEFVLSAARSVDGAKFNMQKNHLIFILAGDMWENLKILNFT